ncbi:MAG: AarF/ABC1/UbiB kinase family protein [Anaerosomatales bacterium]|nr:AarF/ABC1/UbiB kinase family protein [Anaerosomatales bacterium]MDT8434540.1 AarF/ABC1/UbiB kinase family protein [Anaerosomatales bacterium]
MDHPLLMRRRAPEDTSLAPEQRVRRTMERLGPTFAKIGQILSVRRDLIPESFADELARLQDEMEAFPFAEAREEVEASFGQPLEELYAEFGEVPAAAASIGQVHMAVLHDGTPVAVKVQRPGIRDVTEADLDILRTQARRIHGRTDVGRRFDVVALVDEFVRILHEECDYVNEAQNAERLREAFAGDETVYFPRIYWELTSATVLTLERIDGIPFNRLDGLDARGVDRHEIAGRGISCYYEQIFIHGFYHADPHPGNLFALHDGRVAFTDFGRAGVLTSSARAHVTDLLVAIIGQDGELAGDILLEVSRGTADVDAVGLKRDVTNLIRKYYNLKLNEVDTRELLFEIMSLIGRRGLTLESEFALLLTTLATIQSLGTNVDPEFHFVDSVTPFAKRIIEEQTNPATMAKGFTGTVRRTMKALQGLPDNVNRALKRVADGDLRMTVRPGGFDPLMARIEQAIDRLAFALVVSSFVLGFSWLLAPTELAWWLEAIAAFALVCAAGVGVWFFLSIVFRRWRQRRHDQ